MQTLSLNKSGKGGGMKFVITVGVFAVVAIAIFLTLGTFQQTALGDPTTESDGLSDPDSVCDMSTCADTRVWAGTINLENALNKTGIETFDTSVQFYELLAAGGRGGVVTSADTTAGSVNLRCGNTYEMEVLSSSGNDGDSGEITAGPAGTDIANGNAKFTVCGTGSTVSFRSYQHGLPQVKVRDVYNDGLLFDTVDNDATDYETTDGIRFNSSVGGTAATAVGAGGRWNILTYLQPQDTDENVNDVGGTWVLIDADPTVWDTSTLNVKLDGSALSDARGSFDDNEKIAYTGYEYAVLIPASRVITQTAEAQVEISMYAQGGQNPTGAHNISVDYAPRGRYQSISGTNVWRVSGVTDSSSRTDVHTRFDTEFAIS